MKNFRKKMIVALTIVMVFAFCVAFAGCTNDKEPKQNDFEFTSEVVARIDDTQLANELIDYCNKFYKHYLVECEQQLYIENEEISSTVVKKIQDKIQQKMLPIILLGDKEAREIISFYLPFQELFAIRAQEYLQIKYDWEWIEGNFTTTNHSPLTQKYIDGINEQFEILKENYFKK